MNKIKLYTDKTVQKWIFSMSVLTSKLVVKITVISCFLTLGACSLDEQIYDTPLVEGFIKSETDAQYVAKGAYQKFQEPTLYKSTVYAMTQYGGDEFTSTNLGVGFSAGLFINRVYSSNDRYITYVWEAYYQAINRANSALEAIEASPAVPESAKKRLNGELAFLRGFAYFDMVRLWGGVPVRTSSTTPTTDFYASRDSLPKVYEQVFADLKQASANCVMKNQLPSAESGMATKAAAQAMLSLAYLTYANYLDMNNRVAEAQQYYPQAVLYADSVISSGQYSLLSNYADLFNIDNEKLAYNEVIFSFQFTRDVLASGSNSRGSEMAYYFQPNTRTAICGNAPYGKGSGTLKIQPWFYDLYNSGDYINGTSRDYRTDFNFLTEFNGTTSANLPRRYVTYPVIALDATDLIRENQPYLDKYKDSKGLDNRNHENDFFVMRLAEIYLIKAEALNEMGEPDSKRLAPFNELRKRARNANGVARLAPVDLAGGLSKEDFRMAVFNERGLELVGEGHRWFDATRMRYLNTDKSMMQWRFETFYPSMSAAQLALPSWSTSTKKWTGGRVQPVNVSAWSDRYRIYPIPASEMINASFGSQNPGW